jgi:uncharacterized protein
VFGGGVSTLDLTVQNLTHPAILAFGLGVAAVLLRSDLRFPPAAGKLMASFLLLAIGLKGGAALGESSPSALVGPGLVILGLGILTPIVGFAVLARWGRFSVADAASIAAHYGSVSAVTFAAAITFAVAAGSSPEAYLPALLALLEIVGIVVALAIAQKLQRGADLRGAMREVLAGSSSLLLLGGLLIGASSSQVGMGQVGPLFTDLFPGVLVLFLLHLGTVAGERLREARKAGPFLLGFAVGMPLVFGPIGVIAGTAAGLSVGGAAVMGAMAASASYIAAPAAVEASLPDANLAFPLTAALAVTFPFNLAIGIPLYHSIAGAVA